MHLPAGKDQDKTGVWVHPTRLPSPPPWRSWVVWQKTPPFASYISLRTDSDSLVSQPMMLVSHQTMQFCIVWETFGYIWLFLWGQCVYVIQQLAYRRAKCSLSKEKLSDFALGHHTISMEQARSLEVQVQDVHEEKTTILALVSATPFLESNVDMVLFRDMMDCHIQSLSLPVDKRNWSDLLSCTCSNLLHIISLIKYKVKWWSHVVFFAISCHNSSEDVWAYSSATHN